jgi:hypothetical protein
MSPVAITLIIEPAIVLYVDGEAIPQEFSITFDSPGIRYEGILRLGRDNQ